MLYSYNKFIIVISDYLLEVDIQRITTLNCTNVVTSFLIFESKVIFSNYSFLVSEAEGSSFFDIKRSLWKVPRGRDRF